jgi:hypothetical protein
MLRDEAYVPFDIAFSENDGVAKVITGPNMAGEGSTVGCADPAGKSSCVRATVSHTKGVADPQADISHRRSLYAWPRLGHLCLLLR